MPRHTVIVPYPRTVLGRHGIKLHEETIAQGRVVRLRSGRTGERWAGDGAGRAVGSRLRGKDGWGAGVTWVPACAGKTGGGGAGMTVGRRGNDGWGVLAAYVAPLT